VTPLDSRAIVRMATGAALYGVFSWFTNVVPLPSMSFITLRPAIVLPIFFGLQWGVRVGFFAGLVGNLIGDTLTGSGFFLQWDLGNGLVGGVAGLARHVGRSRRAVDLVVAAATLFLVGVGAAMLTRHEPLDGGFTEPGFVPAEHVHWPLGIAVVLAGLWLFLRGRQSSAESVLWGVTGIVVGIGTAALIDVPYNGVPVELALFAEFVPAASSNALFAVVLLPPMVRAYERALSRAGR